MNITSLGKRAVLDLVDAVTKFNSAHFLVASGTKSERAAFVVCWESVHTCLPDRIRVGRGSCFGEEFLPIASGAQIQIVRLGIVAHSCLVVGKTFHQPLRSTFRKATLSMGAHIADNTLLAT